MPGPGLINRPQLQSNYQNAGDIYSDVKTEGAFNLLADQMDANYQELAALKTGFTGIADGGGFTDFPSPSDTMIDGGTFL